MFSRLVKSPPSVRLATRMGMASGSVALNSRPITHTCACVVPGFSSAMIARRSSFGNGGSESGGTRCPFQEANFSSRSRTISAGFTSPATEMTASFGTHHFAWNATRSAAVIDPTDAGVPPEGCPQGCLSP